MIVSFCFLFFNVFWFYLGAVFLSIGQAMPPGISKVSAMSKRTVSMEITAYTCGEESTGKTSDHRAYCLTSSGHLLTEKDEWKSVAADPKHYSPGTVMYIPGVGKVTVRDSGGAIKGPYRLDLFVSKENSGLAYTWGTQNKQVSIYQ